MSDLSDYLNEHLGDRVADDVVREAALHGYVIDRTAVYSYLNGTHAKRPREATLRALAAGVGVDIRKLRELSGRPAGELGPYIPDPRSASLTQDQRKALDRLIVTIVERRGETDGQRPEAPKKTPSGGMTPSNVIGLHAEPQYRTKAADSGREKLDDLDQHTIDENQDHGGWDA